MNERTTGDDATILHITTPEAWAAARSAGEIRPPSLDTEGFVHCSTAAQLDTTLDRHFRGHGPLLTLELDPAAIAADLRWEESHPGERFSTHGAKVMGIAGVAAEIEGVLRAFDHP